jgi:tRNA-2-methylthio-N6-dimethylallyladenosine synthase
VIEAVRDLPKVCRHFHMPVQSGSARILQSMRRRYTPASYIALANEIRAEVPGVTLSTDMIVGFPGETDDDFNQTLALTRTVRFHSMFSFKYSPRPRTLAAKRMPDSVPEPVKTRRIVVLQEVQRAIQGELLTAMVGQTVEVLVDGISRRRASEVSGRTSGNTIVNFAGEASLIGQLVAVRIVEAGPNSLRGEWTPSDSLSPAAGRG